MKCGATGKPEPRIMWFKGDEMISDKEPGFSIESSNEMSTMTIVNMTEVGTF